MNLLTKTLGMLNKKFKLYALLIAVSFLLTNCSTVKEAFDPQRKNGSEEFLVEKKSPLSMPPNFNELPVPKIKQLNKQQDEQKDSVKQLILGGENSKILKTEELNKNTNLENSILDQIKNN